MRPEQPTLSDSSQLVVQKITPLVKKAALSHSSDQFYQLAAICDERICVSLENIKIKIGFEQMQSLRKLWGQNLMSNATANARGWDF